MRIYEATEPSDLLAEAFARLLPQLSERMTAPDREAVARIVASPATRQLVAAAEDGRIVGLLSVALYDVPSGRKAWIEDVVVDAAARGRGIGEALYGAVIELLAHQGFVNAYGTVSVPNRPSERLHEKCGFTHLFTMRRTGWKLGRWRDLAYYHLQLNPYDGEPAPVVPFSGLDGEYIRGVCEKHAQRIKEA